MSSILYFSRNEPPIKEKGGRLSVALVFPADENVALSTLGWQVVYRQLVNSPLLAVERFFIDTKKLVPLETAKVPTSKETNTPLHDFDLICISINFEEDYLHIVRMLMISNIPLYSKDRDNFPLILIGGPVTFLNPAPLAPFTDIFWIGESNTHFTHIAEKLHKHIHAHGVRKDFLEGIANDEGVYIPQISTLPVKRVFADNSDDRILSNPAYSSFISNKATFKDTLLLEINRGCPYACRFCAAGFIYRPPRHAELEKLQEIVSYTAPQKVGLVGTALTDWKDLLPFLKWLSERNCKFSLSSLRADGITDELLQFLRIKGIRTVTLALEAASERLRIVANKKLSSEDFLSAVALCAKYGVNHLRIYMIVGWQDEIEDDYKEFEQFFAKICQIRKDNGGEKKNNFMRITLGVSPLIPKPWTPFQWSKMATEENIHEIFKRLKNIIKPYKGVQLSADLPFQARLQCLLSRGDEKVAEFIHIAAKDGGWKKALQIWKNNLDSYLEEIPQDTELPWDILDLGVKKEYLQEEWRKSKETVLSPACTREGCNSCRKCGIQDII